MATISARPAPIAVGTTLQDPALTLPRSVEAALDRLGELAALPETTARVVALVEDPNATARDLNDVIKLDPALAARILRVVNSAFYSLPTRVANLDRAIVILGHNAVRNIALAVSFSRMFQPGGEEELRQLHAAWKHSIAVGVCARLLGAAARFSPEECFLAGLVHDVGLLAAFQLFPTKLAKLMKDAQAAPGDFCALEQQALGASHVQIGATLAARWKFPLELQAVAAYHHCPHSAPAEYRRIVGFVHTADTLCCAEGIALSVTAAAQALDPAALQELRIPAESVPEVRKKLPECVAEVESVLMPAAK